MKQLNRADAKLLSDVREADDRLARLPEAMLEKDVFITEALLAVAALQNAAMGVIFCGGTSLSKAHRLIERMSAAGVFTQDLVSKLAVEISKNDAIEFASQHPEYAADAKAETARVLEALTKDKRFEEWYDRFVNTMIYGAEKPHYRDVARDFQAIASTSLGLDAAV